MSNIETKLDTILKNAKSADDISFEAVFNISKEMESNYEMRGKCVRYLMNEMKNNETFRGLVCVMLLQMFTSMCSNDSFLLEFCNKKFETEIMEVLRSNRNLPITNELKKFIKDLAAEHENKSSTKKIYTLYQTLENEGFNLPKLSTSTNSDQGKNLSNPLTLNASEDADIKRAIQLSLEEAKKNAPLPAKRQNISIEQPQTTAKVLYDFEASDATELSLKVGELITVTKMCNESWWEGKNSKGQIGLFPSNFVSKDLNAIVPILTNKPIEIDTAKMDLCLSKLLNATPLSLDQELKEIVGLEESCAQMKKEVVQTLHTLKKKDEDYKNLDGQFNEVLQTYNHLMNDPSHQLSSQPVQPQQYWNNYSTQPPQYSNNLPTANNPQTYPQAQDAGYYQYQPAPIGNSQPPQQYSQQNPYVHDPNLYPPTTSSNSMPHDFLR